jgi:erythromycin esterase
MRLLMSSILFLTFVGLSQNKLETIALSDLGSTLNTKYLSALDSTFQKVRLIGLGESTHGTSEFTIIRTDMFKYLVERHGYTVFFLEADYNACERVNRFIQGANDTVEEAVKEIRLWPWLTQELVDLIEWMRLYNQQNENRLQFVGCDMQLIKDDMEEWPRFLASNSKYAKLLSKLPDLNVNSKDSSALKIQRKEWNEFSAAFLIAFPDEEPLKVHSVGQWFEEAVSLNYKGNFRDSCMGNNIADYLERYPKAKGIYFAHNGHVGKIAYQYKDNKQSLKRAGHYLNERLKNQYLAMGLEFHTGSFNAINYVDSTHVMEYFTFDQNHKKSLSYCVMGKEDKIKFIYSTALKSKKHLMYNSIGAIYGKSISGYKVYRYRSLNLDHFDAFIVINSGTPTHLLNMAPRKSESKFW